MIKTQVQLPDKLYQTAKAIAEQREWSFAEVVRRGLEQMAVLYPIAADNGEWELPILKANAFGPNFDDLDFRSLAEIEELRHPST